ncbi:MAG: hypothetical protein JO001_16815, partial [Alphaproteobacteria bacterium]|nr:hypothetical protein [Alphaproteobacteria bacterium]
SLAADFATLQQDTTSTAAGALITLNPNQSITLANVTPSTLHQSNFLISPAKG